ncbi:hypothetical protein DENIS_2936 [Desulfonema ishimotonii]|uniref:Uncharacterized protein n=1 Tax=Desulfonema ishimotonii TaxID=45657 RepID=A0A401FYE9_9BACT|nr:hypothetical protein [Desulfonema ishimotonii]GBC61973.1 hypothetical protein DENIS_2936 [Desulfonema ishimotonii]
MKLSTQDADLFFEIMWGLQYFVNQKLKILPDVQSPEAYIDCATEEKSKVRDALYENSDLIDDFIDENPRDFSTDRLEIVNSWKRFVADDFYIERILKKYAVFIASDNTVYGVLALYDAFEDMIHKSRLPLRVGAVLLPFKGNIIYDGLFQVYNVFFGGGISRDLKEIYMAAKQNGKIVESLDPDTRQVATPRKKAAVKDWTPEFEKLVAGAKKLRGGGGQPAINSPVFSLIRASLELGQMAVSGSDDPDRLWKSFEKAERALRKVENTLYRSGM